jgi:hypothetical protein
MVGLPGQTLRDLAGDVRFFKDLNAHMIGMGPYITEPDTPVAGGLFIYTNGCKSCLSTYTGVNLVYLHKRV